MTAPIRLATSQERVPVRACGTCAHVISDRQGPRRWRCAVQGNLISVERKDFDDDPSCGALGSWWTPRPPRQPGILERVWRWMFGGQA